MGKSKEYFLEIQTELVKTHNECVEGELSNLDALIKMRESKDEAEKVLEIVKNFENDRLNEISEESDAYGGKYCGFEIKSVNGRKTYNFKGISEIQEKENEKKQLEEQYRIAFDGVVKGVVQTTEVDGVKYWIDENSELKPLPELQIGKSYISFKKSK